METDAALVSVFVIRDRMSATPQLSTLDKYLTLWILAAMAAGLLLGRFIPGIGDALGSYTIGTVSLPVAIGLLMMMYPVLAKVRYSAVGKIVTDRKLMKLSLLLNWVIGPLLMFALAWLFLPDLPEYRTGLILIGLARCIAMVLIWNDLACGDREAAVVLVAINSIFQVLAYAFLGYFYLEVLPAWLGLETSSIDISTWMIAKAVLIFLGIPLAAGYFSRIIGERTKGRDWYESRFVPKIAPFALYGLLFTIIILFALQGDKIITQPWNVARIALPLVVYFIVMWFASFLYAKREGFSYERAASVAFTAAGNNFELAIAVAIAVFGIDSGQALAGTVGPLIEVPALILLVTLSLRLKQRWWPSRIQPVRSA
jgi:arsenical-resistance protein